MSPSLSATVREEWHIFLNSLRFFTRIRVPGRIPHSEAMLSLSPKYLPLIGLLVGGACALTFALATMALPQSVSILLAMTAGLLITGAFHEDGLSDTADGLGGGWDRERILAIMKDSRVGNYGVISITMVLLIKFVCLTEVDATWVPALLLAGHAFSRYCAVLIMSGMHYVRPAASSKSKPLAGKLSHSHLIVASIFGLTPLIWLPLPALLLGLAAGLLVTIWFGRKLQKWLGGYTGDCLGAVQQLSEAAFYLGAIAALG